MPKRVVVRSSKYLNNLIEQDHRRIKKRLRPMLGLKSVETAAIVISGIELAEKIKKGQFKIGKLGGRRAMPQEIYRAALAARSVSGSTQRLRPKSSQLPICTRGVLRNPFACTAGVTVLGLLP
jgi:putative transposase